MKLILTFILFTFFGLDGDTILTPSIKNKTFNKAILKSFKVIDFKIEEINTSNEINKGIFHKVYNSEQQLGFSYYGRVNTCRIGGCNNEGYAETTINFDAEYFDYLALFDNEGSVVFLKIYNYNATYGYEVCSKFWLNQFKNYDGEKQIVFGKDIDGVSGATISAEAMTNEIINKTKQLNALIGKL